MLPIDDRLLIITLALALDALFGDPPWLWNRVPHPAALMGRVVARLDSSLNSEGDGPADRVRAGRLAVAVLVIGAVALGYFTTVILESTSVGVLVETVIVGILLAGRSLYIHVKAVATGLIDEGLEGGRSAVRHIVGRDPDSLDSHGVARAGIESAAENFSDGLVAPALWYVLLGLPGIVAYKAINTADSMIGHKTSRHKMFGRTAARLDDWVNWIPARLSAGLIIAAAWAIGEDSGRATESVREDAVRHRSRNAGWPEAAMAGALGISLAGPRRYGRETVEDAWMNRGGRDDATADDINRALKLLVWSAFLMWAGYAVISLLV